jgi:hypothetical protein
MSADLSITEVMWHAAKFVGVLALLLASCSIAGYVIHLRRANRLYQEQISYLTFRETILKKAARYIVIRQRHDAGNHSHNAAVERAAQICDARIGPDNPVSTAVRALRVRPRCSDRVIGDRKREIAE